MGTGKKRKRQKQTLTNRELSWLQFNRRVQMEAGHQDNPLLERAKFLGIVTSNLDEFIQVRYGGICEAAWGKKSKHMQQGGHAAKGLYHHVNKAILKQQDTQYTLYEGIRGELYAKGVQLYPIFPMTETLRQREAEIYKKEIKPNLRQLSPGEEPQQKQLHLFVKLLYAQRKTVRYVVVALPTALPRLYDLSTDPRQRLFIRLEDIVRHHLPSFFPKEQVEAAAVFRVLRNQDYTPVVAPEPEIAEEVRGMLRMRRTGRVMRLEAEERMNDEMLRLLSRRFSLKAEQRYRSTGPLDLNKLMMNLYGETQRSDLKYQPAEPVLCTELMGEDVFERMAARDHFLFHPYHSFDPVVHLLEQAAKDPAVRSMEQTLYRVSGNSPIVQALALAAENGKQVTVVFEAYARFDEENNLFWGERLEQAGCRVIFGIPGLKTHSKITLIERDEGGETKGYLHLGTGNYHEGTAKLYTDMGLLTADPVLAQDARHFFQSLESGGEPEPMEALVKAPEELKTTLLHLIEREKEHSLEGRPAGIIAKMNSLSDEAVIAALYSASNAGVEVRLIVRGICCLIPQVEGLSENIRVISIVGRHLEHARAFRFENGGESEVYLSSADWMPRNLQKREELMFPVRDETCKQAVERVLELQWLDTEKAREKQANGEYIPREVLGMGLVNAQETLLRHLPEILSGIDPIEEIVSPAPANVQEEIHEDAG